jgi:asparagine synthase (glutamine-hydrolysing)
MCGIAGIFGKNERQTLEAMLTAITHRGPDDEHSIAGPSFCLGARRLSVVDIAGGRQPMSNERQTVWAAQNGEIYNAPQLQPALIARGHIFQSKCDTEILPHLYEEYGSGMVSTLDGMFALALWDTQQELGLLARDRAGKKPLYYTEQAGALYFASEIKALLHIPGFQRRVNIQALQHYLSLKHVPAPLTIFENIHVLPPAHTLVFRPGHKLLIQRYWTPIYSRPELVDISEDEATEFILKYLQEGIQKRFMSDVPIGFYLSGGIDSSLTTALASELLPGKLKTFTLIYHDQACHAGKQQDRDWARFVSKQLGSEHHEEELHFGNFPDELRAILRCFDQPFAGVVSSYFLARLLAKHVKVAISGDGADELFGSYLSHRLAVPVLAALECPDRVKQLSTLPDWAWRAQLSVFTDEEKQELCNPDMRPESTAAYWASRFGALTSRDPLNRVLEAEFASIFPDQVLNFVDKLSMAHSLEVRTPFLDTQLMEFVMGLPGTCKISRQGVTKHLLKRAAARYFPEAMISRPKEGFLMPITQWMQNDLQRYVRDTLHPRRLQLHGFFQPQVVAKLLDAVYTKACDYHIVNKVYSLLVFQEWYELYMTSR